MDKYRYDNQSAQWRKRRGAQRRRARLLASIPKRLVFVTVAAMAAFVAQFVVQHSEGIPELNVSHWIGRSPAPIAGAASVIDGDTIEVHGQRIRFNGIDAPGDRPSSATTPRAFATSAARRPRQPWTASWPARCRSTVQFVAWDRYKRFVGRLPARRRRQRRRVDGRARPGARLAPLQPWRLCGAASEGRSGEGRAVGRNVSGAVGLACWACGQLQAVEPAARYHRAGGYWRKAAIHASRGEPARKSDPARKPTGICRTARGAGKLDRDKDGIPCESLC